MKRFIVISLCATFLAGCHTAPDTTTSSTRSLSDIAFSTLRAPAVGRAWDKGVRAAANNDLDGLVGAAKTLRTLGAKREATRLGRAASEALVARAGRLDVQSYRATSDAKQKMQSQAALLYRRALEIEPDFDSENPVLLNTLGYFLADRGTTQADFVLAEKLTRRAIKALEAQTPLGRVFLDDLASRAALRDSLAWALFRQGKWQEALREQNIAVRDAERATRDKTDESSQDLRRELREHLRQIEAAANPKKS